MVVKNAQKINSKNILENWCPKTILKKTLKVPGKVSKNGAQKIYSKTLKVPKTELNNIEFCDFCEIYFRKITIETGSRKIAIFIFFTIFIKTKLYNM
jgi:hypothetical protein